jgi:hypothetical protein
MAPAAVNMCAASESSASECTAMPTTTSKPNEANQQGEGDLQLATVGVSADAVAVSASSAAVVVSAVIVNHRLHFNVH